MPLQLCQDIFGIFRTVLYFFSLFDRVYQQQCSRCLILFNTYILKRRFFLCFLKHYYCQIYFEQEYPF